MNPKSLRLTAKRSPTKRVAPPVPTSSTRSNAPSSVRLRYLNYKGEQVEEWAEGMYAVCIQHEMDHLQGTLFIDHLSRLKRPFAIAKVKKAKKKGRGLGL